MKETKHQPRHTDDDGVCHPLGSACHEPANGSRCERPRGHDGDHSPVPGPIETYNEWQPGRTLTTPEPCYVCGRLTQRRHRACSAQCSKKLREMRRKRPDEWRALVGDQQARWAFEDTVETLTGTVLAAEDGRWGEADEHRAFHLTRQVEALRQEAYADFTWDDAFLGTLERAYRLLDGWPAPVSPGRPKGQPRVKVPSSPPRVKAPTGATPQERAGQSWLDRVRGLPPVPVPPVPWIDGVFIDRAWRTGRNVLEAYVGRVQEILEDCHPQYVRLWVTDEEAAACWQRADDARAAGEAALAAWEAAHPAARPLPATVGGVGACPRPDKVRYRSHAAAARFITDRAGGWPGRRYLEAYECACGSWHVGNAEQRWRERQAG